MPSRNDDTTTSTRKLSIILLVAASLLLAGCAGPGGSNGGDTTSEEPAAEDGGQEATEDPNADDKTSQDEQEPSDNQDDAPDDGASASGSNATIGPRSEMVEAGDVRVHPLTVRTTGEDSEFPTEYAVGWVENTGDRTLDHVRLELRFEVGETTATAWRSVGVPILPGEKVPFGSAPTENLERSHGLEVLVNETGYADATPPDWFSVGDHNGSKTTDHGDEEIYRVQGTVRNEGGSESASAFVSVASYDDEDRLLDAGWDSLFATDPGETRPFEVDLHNPNATARYDVMVITDRS